MVLEKQFLIPSVGTIDFRIGKCNKTLFVRILNKCERIDFIRNCSSQGSFPRAMNFANAIAKTPQSIKLVCLCTDGNTICGEWGKRIERQRV